MSVTLNTLSEWYYERTLNYTYKRVGFFVI